MVDRQLEDHIWMRNRIPRIRLTMRKFFRIGETVAIRIERQHIIAPDRKLVVEEPAARNLATNRRPIDIDQLAIDPKDRFRSKCPNSPAPFGPVTFRAEVSRQTIDPHGGLDLGGSQVDWNRRKIVRYRE